MRRQAPGSTSSTCRSSISTTWRGSRARRAACAEIGFTGKGAIHPKQIPVLNECFSPSEEEVERARRVVAEFDGAGTGLVVIDGKLIEKPVLRSMHRILAIADRMPRAG